MPFFALKTAIAGCLVFGLANSQTTASSIEVINSLPPCALACIENAFSASNVSRTDIYSICNDPVFDSLVVPCERDTCNSDELQEITSKAGIVCAPVGGFKSTVYTARVANIPDCSNNCTSTVLAATDCTIDDLNCLCESPISLNIYGPCVAAVCNATDAARFTSASAINCAPYGGSGPFNASQIEGYLNFTNVNGTVPPVPLLNSTTTNPPPAIYTGAAGSVTKGTLWVLGTVMTGVVLLM